MEITRADISDVDRILDVRATVRTSYYPSEELGITAEGVHAAQLELRDTSRIELVDQVKDPDHYLVEVLRDENEGVVGYCLSSKSDEEGCRLDYIHILPEHQGRGHGRELIKRTLSWLGSESPITLEVVKHNERGLAIWASLGFIAIGDAPEEYSTTADGVVVPHFLMQRPAKK